MSFQGPVEGHYKTLTRFLLDLQHLPGNSMLFLVTSVCISRARWVWGPVGTCGAEAEGQTASHWDFLGPYVASWSDTSPPLNPPSCAPRNSPDRGDPFRSNQYWMTHEAGAGGIGNKWFQVGALACIFTARREAPQRRISICCSVDRIRASESLSERVLYIWTP